MNIKCWGFHKCSQCLGSNEVNSIKQNNKHEVSYRITITNIPFDSYFDIYSFFLPRRLTSRRRLWLLWCFFHFWLLIELWLLMWTSFRWLLPLNNKHFIRKNHKKFYKICKVKAYLIPPPNQILSCVFNNSRYLNRVTHIWHEYWLGILFSWFTYAIKR